MLSEFGFKVPEPASTFLDQGQFLSLGKSPLRIEILTAIDGVDFDDCFKDRNVFHVDELAIKVIGLEQLKTNKRASGRLKDLNDLQNLPGDSLA